jgi:TetR/AcrR family transcriptional repressor of mexJK operon
MVDLLARDIGADAQAASRPPASPKRKAIVEAATALFLAAGYGAVSMDAIAGRAGVSKRTLYCHFPGKDALFGAVMGNVCANVIGTRPPEELTEGAPHAVLTDYGRTFLTLITSRQALALFRVVTAESVRFPELGEIFYRLGPQRWTGLLSTYLGEQHRKGALCVPDPGAAAAQFLAMVKGPVHMRLSLGVGARPDKGEIDAVVEAAVGAFLRAYRAPPGEAR